MLHNRYTTAISVQTSGTVGLHFGWMRTGANNDDIQIDLIFALHRRVYSTVKKLHRRLGRDSNPRPSAY